MPTIVPVILCGGSGTRLWPLSRSALPKQFLPLVSANSMLQETVLRLRGFKGAEAGAEAGLEAPIAVCNDEHRFVTAEQLREVGCAPRALLLEPAGRGTAPAVAAAAMLVPEAILVVLAADHLISDIDALHAALRRAIALAGEGNLVVFGIPPTAAETGFGYIRRGAALGGDAYRVESFVEKPPAERARQLFAEGAAWNSGMFVFRAARYLEELEAHQPQVVAQVAKAVAGARRDLDFVRLEAEAFLACPAHSVDTAVMEKTRQACVVQAKFGWSDVGSFDALWQVRPKDADGNALRGDVIAAGARNCYLHSESRLVAVVGVENLLVVETGDAVLVADKAHAQRVREIVEGLRRSQRHEQVTHQRVYRPWGYYESLDAGERYQVKRLMIKPGARISLQLHRRRAEHWVVVSGTARITQEARVFDLEPNQSTYIAQGTRHRLENPGAEPLYVIEVQSGDYFGEDDIERFADDYQRD